jgi:hypothetical protein
MSTQEILSIIALSLLGLCFLCGLAKMAMKKDSDKKNCDKACSMAIFAAVALVGVSQLLTETDKYDPKLSQVSVKGDGCYCENTDRESCSEGDSCSCVSAGAAQQCPAGTCTSNGDC